MHCFTTTTRSKAPNRKDHEWDVHVQLQANYHESPAASVGKRTTARCSELIMQRCDKLPPGAYRAHMERNQVSTTQYVIEDARVSPVSLVTPSTVRARERLDQASF